MDKQLVQNKKALIELLEGAGAKFYDEQCTCPFHLDRNPSAGIFRDDTGHWRFRCFVCDITYDYYDILAKRENMDIAETLRMEPKEERTKHVYSSYWNAVGENVDSLHEYRDMEGNFLVSKIRLRTDTSRGKTYLMVSPYCGGFVRKGPEVPWPLYNLSGIADSGNKGIIVVEGEKCADALNEMGFVATTALSSSSINQTDWTPLYGKRIVIWRDNDNTGEKYAKEVQKQLMSHCIVTQVNPESLGLNEKEDVVDYIEKGHGSDDIRAILVETAKQTPAKEVEQYIEGMINGTIKAIKWPWPLLHEFSQALLPGTITVIVGAPCTGKSFFIMEALAYWIDRGERVGLHVLEENNTFHLLRALAQKSGLSDLSKSEWVEANPEIARQAMANNWDFVERMGQHLSAQPEKQVSLEEIFSWMNEQFKAGCRIVAVDPITAAGRTDNIWIADEKFVLDSKKLADKYKARIIFVTHPKKDDCTPYLGNIRGGAAYQQFAQNVFWLEKTGPRIAELANGTQEIINRRLHILKARNARESETGILAYTMTKGLRFNEHGEFQQYRDE